MDEKKKLGKFPKFILFQSILIGLLFAADQIFGFFEQNFFNTFLIHVLFLPEIYVSIMVSLSAIMGLIFNLVWGIIGDNTRSKLGRRRPYLITGGIITGFAAIAYAFSPNYFWALFLDVVIIGILKFQMDQLCIAILLTKILLNTKRNLTIMHYMTGYKSKNARYT